MSSPDVKYSMLQHLAINVKDALCAYKEEFGFESVSNIMHSYIINLNTVEVRYFLVVHFPKIDYKANLLFMDNYLIISNATKFDKLEYCNPNEFNIENIVIGIKSSVDNILIRGLPQ